MKCILILEQKEGFWWTGLVIRLRIDINEEIDWRIFVDWTQVNAYRRWVDTIVHALNKASITKTLIASFNSCNQIRSAPKEIIVFINIAGNSLPMNEFTGTCQLSDKEVIWCNHLSINVNNKVNCACLGHVFKEYVYSSFFSSASQIVHESSISITLIENLESSDHGRATPMVRPVRG